MGKTLQATGSASILHLLHRASQYSDELFAKAIGAGELTARQLIVLEIVSEEKKPSQTRICAKSGIDRSTLADIVGRLVAKGLLARRRTREDARKYAVRLTDEGRWMLGLALPLVHEVDKRITSGLLPHQRQEFTTALQRIVEASQREHGQ